MNQASEKLTVLILFLLTYFVKVEGFAPWDGTIQTSLQERRPLIFQNCGCPFVILQVRRSTLIRIKLNSWRFHESRRRKLIYIPKAKGPVMHYGQGVGDLQKGREGGGGGMLLKRGKGRERGGGGYFSHVNGGGGGHYKLWDGFNMEALSFSHTEGGGGGWG